MKHHFDSNLLTYFDRELSKLEDDSTTLGEVRDLLESIDVTLDIKSFFAGSSGNYSGLPENSRESEPLEIEYDIVVEEPHDECRRILTELIEVEYDIVVEEPHDECRRILTELIEVVLGGDHFHVRAIHEAREQIVSARIVDPEL